MMRFFAVLVLLLFAAINATEVVAGPTATTPTTPVGFRLRITEQVNPDGEVVPLEHYYYVYSIEAGRESGKTYWADQDQVVVFTEPGEYYLSGPVGWDAYLNLSEEDIESGEELVFTPQISSYPGFPQPRPVLIRVVDTLGKPIQGLRIREEDALGKRWYPIGSQYSSTTGNEAFVFAYFRFMVGTAENRSELVYTQDLRNSQSSSTPTTLDLQLVFTGKLLTGDANLDGRVNSVDRTIWEMVLTASDFELIEDLEVNPERLDPDGNGFSQDDFLLIAKQYTGDVNLDGKVNVTDATAILRIVVRAISPTDTQVDQADVDLSGKVNVLDAVTLLRRIVGLE